MNTRPRLLLWSSFVSAGTRMSKKTKPPTHYETLKVNPRATQSEIKSAYFKLSKEYHPDKNSSEAAVAKFRDVTEAYEVLGSFASRKNYDRSILTHTKYQGTRRSDDQQDPKIKYYQSQAAIFRDQQKSGSTPSYDFDAWTKAHYGKTLDRAFKDKAYASQRKEIRIEDMHDGSNYSVVLLMCVTILIMTTGMLVSWQQTDYDNPSLIVHKRDSVDVSRTSERNSEQAKLPTKS